MTDSAEAFAKPKRTYSTKTIKVLFGMSRNQCANPDCINPIIAGKTDQSDALVVGQIAHIYAASDEGPRGDPGLSDEQRNHADNLLLLCPTCHVIVDGQHETYPAATLLAWKQKHERQFQEALGATIGDLGFLELELAAKALMTAVSTGSQTDLRQIPPEEKIVKNELGATSSMFLKMGAAKSADVEQVLLKAAQLDASFPDRLRQGFVTKYISFFESGLRSDELFLAIYDWASGSNPSKQRDAAGLCILAHLFIICDVFEK